MRNWKILAIAAALGASLIVLIVREGSNAAHHPEITPPPVSLSETRQPLPREKMFDDSKPDSGYGWGPFRTTDW